MSRPTIKRGPASRYQLDGETIVEVFSRKLQKGCLVSIREESDGTLTISPYRADKGVKVRAGRRFFNAAS